jgi:hypothetical protein
MVGLKNLWASEGIEEAFSSSCTKKDINKIKSLPRNVAWAVWLAKNLKLFEDKETFPLKCVV